MQGVAREDGEERVVDRELCETGDVLPTRSVVARGAVETLRHVCSREFPASARVHVAPSLEGLRGGAQGSVVERLVHRAPGIGHRPSLVVGELENACDEPLHGRWYAGIGTG